MNKPLLLCFYEEEIQSLKFSDRQKQRRQAAISALADELQITITEAFEIFVDRWAQKRSKTESVTAVVDAFCDNKV